MTDLSSPSKLPLRDAGQLQELANHMLSLAKKQGATSADVGGSVSDGFEVTVRQGDVDTLIHDRDSGLGITVYFGHRVASASTADLSLEAMQETVTAACNMAKYTQEDPCQGLADKEFMAHGYPTLDLHYPWPLTVEQAIIDAKTIEAAGFSADKRIDNSDGASISSHETCRVYANSHGFNGTYKSTGHSRSCLLLAREGNDMQINGEYFVTRDYKDLPSLQSIGKKAAEKVLSRLGGRRIATQATSVIWHADVAHQLLSCLTQAISGSKLYRKSSFLLDSLDKQIFPEFITLTERPHLSKGLASTPFDNEGVRTQEKVLLENGVLKSYLLASYSARKLGMQTTGNAGGLHNLDVNTSDSTLKDLIREMDKGLLVTDLMGHGTNLVTGDYSQGASGFWVENGEIQFPVEEVTIAGNLKDMFKGIIKIANDVDFNHNIRTGSILMEKMMVAGE